MKVSLVVATVGRTHQLARLLESLALQTWQDFECIIVDQNPPGTLDALLVAHGCTPEASDAIPVTGVPPAPGTFRTAGTSQAEGTPPAPDTISPRPAYRLRHLRYLPARYGGATGVSAARNAGLGCVSGDIVGFPDDDCHYAADTLANVVAAFRDAPDLSGIVGRRVTPQVTPQATPGAMPGVMPGVMPGDMPGVTPQLASGDVPQDQPTGGNPAVSRKALHRFSAFRGSETYLLFFRHAVVRKVGGFDPTLGPGTGLPFGCGEDTDYLLRAIACGFRVARAAGVHVHHPAVDPASPGVAAKAYAYGVGRARLLRKHRLPAWFIACNVAYPLARLPLEGPKAFAYRWNMFRGRLAGLVTPFADSPPSGPVSPCGPVSPSDPVRPCGPAPPHGPT